MSDNPFDLPPGAAAPDFAEDFGLSGVKRDKPIPPGYRLWDGGLITEPGAYIGIPITRYHGAEICDSPSISSTGLKKLSGAKSKKSKGCTPRHFWEGSNLNPNRRPTEQTDALRLGSAFHDALLMPDDWRNNWHRLPEGFSRAAKVKMAAEIAEADAAIAAGLSVVTPDEVERIECMVAAMRADDNIASLIADGEPEVTLAWKVNGVWVRARPDWMPRERAFGLNVKTDADASFDGFSRSIGTFGYAQSAALELDGYKAVFGDEPTAYFHPVVEKPGKDWRPGDYIATALWQLPAEDIERGRWLNSFALQTFAQCLNANEWPGYTVEAEPCGLPGWARYMIDNGGNGENNDDDISGE